MMSSSPTRGHSTLTGRRERNDSTNPILNVNLLSRILPYAANNIKSPFIFKSVCTAWAEAVVDYGAGSNSWKFYFDRLRREDPEKANVQLMKLLKFTCSHIVKSPKDYWCLHSIFSACDELHFRIDRLTKSVFTARNSLFQNNELTQNEHEGEFKRYFSNFCRLFFGSARREVLCETLRDCFASPNPQNIKIVKIIVDNHCDPFIENVLIGRLEHFAFGLPRICNELPILLQGLQKLNKLDAARNILLKNEHFLLRAVSNFSANELHHLLLVLKDYLGDSFLRRVFSEPNVNVLAHALRFLGKDCCTVLIETASSIDDDFFVDLCLMVDCTEFVPPFALACFLELKNQAEIILSKIRNIKDSSLVRRFVVSHQNLALEDARTRKFMMELLKKEGLIEEDE